MQLSGSVALVTGSSGGIGSAVCARLADRGARVLVHGRDPARTEAVAARVGGTPLISDLSTRGGVDQLAAAARDVHGRVDILVNNAGTGWVGPFETMPDQDLHRILQVDLDAQIALTRALLAGMIARRRGHVTFVGSVAGRTGVAGEAVYAAAKAGLDVFAESLRLETAGTGVGVGVVVPAAVSTGFLDRRGSPYRRRFPRPMDPVIISGAIVNSIESDRPEAWIPAWLRVAEFVRVLAPGPYRRLAARFGQHVPRRDDPVERDDGDALP